MKEIFKIITIEPLGLQVLFIYSKTPAKCFEKNINKKKNKKISKWLYSHLSEFNIGDGDGGVIRVAENARPVVLYVRNTSKKDWNLYETIIHETNHLVEDFADYCKFNDELEFKAYLQESVFRTIRRLID